MPSAAGRVWDADFGGSQSPWVAGDYIYVLTNEQELLCLTRADGHVRWISALPKSSRSAGQYRSRSSGRGRCSPATG